MEMQNKKSRQKQSFFVSMEIVGIQIVRVLEQQIEQVHTAEYYLQIIHIQIRKVGKREQFR